MSSFLVSFRLMYLKMGVVDIKIVFMGVKRSHRILGASKINWFIYEVK